MKKVLLLVLCFVFVAGSVLAGAGGNAGATKDNPRQAGKSSVYFYDVECNPNPNLECEVCTTCNGYGTFVIDTEKKTFNFIGHDFIPMRKVEISGIGNFIVRGKATQSGNVHIQGEWEGNIVPPPGSVGSAWYYYDPAFGFMGQSLAGYVCRLKMRYSLDDGATWHTTSTESELISFGETYKIKIEDYVDSTVPSKALIQLKAAVSGGDDTWTEEIFYYAKGGDPMFCWPYTLLHGPTWNAWIEYYNDQCQYSLDSDYWYIWGEDVW